MASRSLSKEDWARLNPTKEELRTARLCIKAVVGSGLFSHHDIDGPLTKDGMYAMELFDLVCVLRGEGLKRQRDQVRREDRRRWRKEEEKDKQRQATQEEGEDGSDVQG